MTPSQPDPCERLFGALFRLLSPLIRRVLRSNLPNAGNMLLTVRGRRTGKPRTTPAATFEIDGRRFIQASFGEVNWVQNLRAAGRAVVSVHATSEPVTAIELAPEAAAALMRAALATYPRRPLLARLLGPRVRPPVGVLHRFHLRIDETMEDYLVEARRHPLFELVPAPRPDS